MPTFEYVCPTHGAFEIFFESFREAYSCPLCGEQSPQQWLNFPSLDKTAASAWNMDYDPRVGTFTDKKKYHEAVDRAGYRFKEPGTDKDAEARKKEIWNKGKQELQQRVGAWVQDHTIDQLQNMMKVDAQILEAQQKGEASKLKQMGVPASLNEAYADANPPLPPEVKIA